MKSPEFKVGEVVQLKSGGPRMTVYKVKSDCAICQWFTPEASMADGSFPLPSLQRVEVADPKKPAKATS